MLVHKKLAKYLGGIDDDDVLIDIFIYSKNMSSQDANVSICNNEGTSYV